MFNERRATQKSQIRLLADAGARGIVQSLMDSAKIEEKLRLSKKYDDETRTLVEQTRMEIDALVERQQAEM